VVGQRGALNQKGRIVAAEPVGAYETICDVAKQRGVQSPDTSRRASAYFFS
jgi:hypothetical protein